MIDCKHTVILNNGVEMPVIGLGTHTLSGLKMLRSVRYAYRVGYRNFDTAWLYKNEVSLAWSLKLLGIKRRDVFITSKLEWKQLVGNNLNGEQVRSVKECFESTLHRLKTDYIDLYLIHWPNPKYYLHMWEEMVKLQKEGYIRAIGVSSFLEPHLECLKTVSNVLPAVNQIELHPLNNRLELIRYCNEQRIQIEAHSPFARGASAEELMCHPVLQEIAASHDKSVAQIILRWVVQQGCVTIPRSKNPERIAQNIDIFNFDLSSQEMDKIYSLNRNRFFGGNPGKTLSYL